MRCLDRIPRLKKKRKKGLGRDLFTGHWSGKRQSVSVRRFWHA
jgi:hypothetical protein